MAQPRVAVIGGGIAGTLCSLVLRNRGASPLIIDAGKRGAGGRLCGGQLNGIAFDGGVQFIRAADPRLTAVMALLEQKGLVAKWKGRFGMLGSRSGGFLPSEIVGATAAMTSKQAKDNDVDDNRIPDTITSLNATDGGDFCGFVTHNRIPTYVGTPNMSELCPSICRLAGIEVWHDSKVIAAETRSGGGWSLHTEGASKGHDETFDALVLATHDPSLASSIVQSIAEKEQQASQENNSGDDSVGGRLFKLADALKGVRETGRIPVYTFSATYPEGFSERIDFDAVSVHGSSMIQFLARNASKPQRQHGELWTGVSTSTFANNMMISSQHSNNDAVASLLLEELARLVAPSFGGGDASLVVPKPLKMTSALWRTGFQGASLNLLEDSVALAPWRLAISGDYISKLAAHSTPLEAAALSGLEAGERVAAFFQQEQ